MTIPEVIPYSFKTSVPENTVSWFWDFGDGTTSEEANPTHGFDFMGTVYNVCLGITTADGCANHYCAPVYINNRDTITPPDCQAFFTWSVWKVTRNNMLSRIFPREPIPTGWFWDFGDGTYSTEQNPVHHSGNQ